MLWERGIVSRIAAFIRIQLADSKEKARGALDFGEDMIERIGQDRQADDEDREALQLARHELKRAREAL